MLMVGVTHIALSHSTRFQLPLEPRESITVNPVSPHVKLVSTHLPTAPLVLSTKTEFSVCNLAFPDLATTKMVIWLPPCATILAESVMPPRLTAQPA